MESQAFCHRALAYYFFCPCESYTRAIHNLAKSEKNGIFLRSVLLQILIMTEWDSSFAPLLSHNKAESIGQSGYFGYVAS
ncbi:hypothetical protein [Helicobacter rodentium]|uniref:hypothetical protein n=1 Tax=Helicobacter rodentium TaxID=59617 RepID=UPI0023F53251|nr:hypothetical protein [Helicobacter rodentium]